MNPILKAVDDVVGFKIPRPILEATFIEREIGWRLKNSNLSQLIIDTVVKPRILVDCNIIGGTEIFIPLATCPMERISDYVSVYYIPKSLTQNRTITSVMNITFNDPTYATSYGAAASSNNSIMLRGGQAMVDAMGVIPVTSTANVQLIGENTVMVRENILLPANTYLRCIVENDETLSHLQIKSYRAFSNLVTLAVKSYIYNTLKIKIDMGELMAGMNLGVFKEIVDGYADSEELYQTYLKEVMQKVFFMNDRETYSRFIKVHIGSFR